MRFMLMFKTDKPTDPGTSACKRELPEMGRLMKELTDAGVIVATEGLLPSEFGARVKYRDGGKHAVVDGPFAEAKEIVAGFAVVDVKDKAAAVELAKRFLSIAGEGESDVLQVFEAPTGANR
jgi:hypothetical protein